MSDTVSLQGEVHTWEFGGVKREYTVVTLPFGVANQIYKPEIYSAKTGHGEQRSEIDAHVKKLQKAMATGKFTPTVVSVACKEKNKKGLTFSELKIGEIPTKAVELVVNTNSSPTLPLLDGGQRLGAMRKLLAAAATEEDRARVEALPVTAFIYFDGNTREDFINLNQGKTIDAAHLLSMRIQQKTIAEKHLPYYRLALDIAKILHNDKDSPFYNHIRFDSRASYGIPVTTLCAKGSSDIATSFMGLARIALHAPNGPYRAEEMAEMFKNVFDVLKEKAPDLLAANKWLTPPPDGSKGSATMLIGLAVLYTYFVTLDEKSQDEVQEELISAATETLDEMVLGRFSGPDKREAMGRFAKVFFQNVEVEKYHSIPKELVSILSPSTFALPKMPKEKKPKTPKKAKTVKAGDKVVAGSQEATVLPAIENDPNVQVQVEIVDSIKDAYEKATTHEEQSRNKISQLSEEYADKVDQLKKDFENAIVISPNPNRVEEETPSGEHVDSFEPGDEVAPWEEVEEIAA